MVSNAVIEDATNFAYEPTPAWDCNHVWVNVGYPIVVWQSNTTNSEPPEGVPAMQKRKCLICGGYEWTYVEGKPKIERL